MEDKNRNKMNGRSRNECQLDNNKDSILFYFRKIEKNIE